MPEPTPYFAYGSNLWAAQVAQRCPTATEQGVAYLDGWRVLINQRGCATITPDQTATVWGLLWSLTPDDEAALDGYEGVATGRYRKDQVEVVDIAGRTIEAMTYVDPIVEPGPPKPGYLEKVLRGAEDHALPAEHLAHLRSLGRT